MITTGMRYSKLFIIFAGVNKSCKFRKIAQIFSMHFIQKIFALIELELVMLKFFRTCNGDKRKKTLQNL